MCPHRIGGLTNVTVGGGVSMVCSGHTSECPKAILPPSDDQYGIGEVVSFLSSHWLIQVSEQRGRWRQSGNMGLRADRLQSQSLLPGQSSLMFQRLRKSNLFSLAFKVKSRSILHPCFVVHSIQLTVTFQHYHSPIKDYKSASGLSVAVQAQQMSTKIPSIFFNFLRELSFAPCTVFWTLWGLDHRWIEVGVQLRTRTMPTKVLGPIFSTHQRKWWANR